MYQPSWCRIETNKEGRLLVEDKEPYDYARLVRMLPVSDRLRVSIRLSVQELEEGKSLQLELCNEKHQTAVRVLFRTNGKLNHRTVCELGLDQFKLREEILLTIEADCKRFTYTVAIDGRLITDDKRNPSVFPFMAAVNKIAELSLRTGEPRYLADLEQNPDNLPVEPLTGGRLRTGAKILISCLEAEMYSGNPVFISSES